MSTNRTPDEVVSTGTGDVALAPAQIDHETAEQPTVDVEQILHGEDNASEVVAHNRSSEDKGKDPAPLAHDLLDSSAEETETEQRPQKRQRTLEQTEQQQEDAIDLTTVADTQPTASVADEVIEIIDDDNDDDDDVVVVRVEEGPAPRRSARLQNHPLLAAIQSGRGLRTGRRPVGSNSMFGFFHQLVGSPMDLTSLRNMYPAPTRFESSAPDPEPVENAPPRPEDPEIAKMNEEAGLSNRKLGKGGGLTCPICKSEPTNVYSTWCGHIFCYDCIYNMVKINKKCAICRQKVTMKQIHPLYT
eukprot:Clim_evm88s11 gene=Clim_evmTU88s11